VPLHLFFVFFSGHVLLTGAPYGRKRLWRGNSARSGCGGAPLRALALFSDTATSDPWCSRLLRWPFYGEAEGGLTWFASDGERLCLPFPYWPVDSGSQGAPRQPRRLAAGRAPCRQTNMVVPPLHTSAKREAGWGLARWLNPRRQFNGPRVTCSDSADCGSIASRAPAERRTARNRTRAAPDDRIVTAWGINTRAGYARHGKSRSTQPVGRLVFMPVFMVCSIRDSG